MQVQVWKYFDEEYETLIRPVSGDWSREETDYLLDMCERFDLRFIVIADKYEVCDKEAWMDAIWNVRAPGLALYRHCQQISNMRNVIRRHGWDAIHINCGRMLLYALCHMICTRRPTATMHHLKSHWAGVAVQRWNGKPFSVTPAPANDLLNKFHETLRISPWYRGLWLDMFALKHVYFLVFVSPPVLNFSQLISSVLLTHACI